MKAIITWSTAMERVLRIPELLDIIFGMMDSASNATNARVCTLWSSRAFDVLWREVDLHRLFSFLAPLKGNPKIGFQFEKPPDADHWRKFERYSLRVRRLEYHSSQGILRQSIFNDVARTRLRLDILPNMHTLSWEGPLDVSVTFMHPGVKTFDIWLPSEIPNVSPRPFFQDVVVRMPNLVNLDIKSDVAVHEYEVDLVDFIHRLPKLRRITVPRFYITTKIIEALSQLPVLEVIEFQYDDQGCGYYADVIPFTPLVGEGSFTALRDLSLSTTYEDISRFFSLEFSPTNLTSLYIDSPIIETAATIYKFLCAVVNRCQLLKALSVVSLRSPDSEPDDGDEHYEITVEHIKPVFKLGNLKTLEVSHRYPLALNIEDLKSLACSWPSLETLILNSEPVLILRSDLTLDALLPFASHCPNLVHLGLFVDASRIHASSAPVPFKRLKRLSMGVSIIDDHKSVALYLSRVLPAGCNVECGVTWDDEELSSADTSKEAFERCSRWEQVDRLLPVLIELRAEEKDRLKVLENEMDDLRLRNDMLSDSLKLGLSSQVMSDNSCVVF